MLSYDVFTVAFLRKISGLSISDFLDTPEQDRERVIDGYMKSALAAFRKNCRVDLYSTADDEARMFYVELPPWEADEIADVVSEGMVALYAQSILYNRELMENVLGTKDFSFFSPAQLLQRVGEVYERARGDFKQKICDYSYNHMNLRKFHQHGKP